MNTPVPTHSPDGAKLNAVVANLLAISCSYHTM